MTNNDLVDSISAMQKLLDEQSVPLEGRWIALPNAVIKLRIGKKLNARRWKKKFKKVFGAWSATVSNSSNKRRYYR